jgi:hypothetical protein
VASQRLAVQVGRDRLQHVQRLECHRGVVGESQPDHTHDPLPRRDLQPSAELGTGHDLVDLQGPARGNGTALAHVLRERRHCQALRDLGLTLTTHSLVMGGGQAR